MSWPSGVESPHTRHLMRALVDNIGINAFTTDLLSDYYGCLGANSRSQ